MTNQYNTYLTPEQEAQFQAQMADRLGDLYDYDLRGAWLANAGQADNGHYPDTYKKPNHPTFSQESQYSTPQMQGGTWSNVNGTDYFNPSMQNIINTGGARGLQEYFRRAEPTARLNPTSMQEAINALAQAGMNRR